MHLAVLAALVPTLSFHVIAWAHKCHHPFHLLLGAFSPEDSLPGLTLGHLEFFNLIVIGDSLCPFSFEVSPLTIISVGALALPFPSIFCPSFGVVILLQPVVGLIEMGGRMASKQ